MRGTLAVVAAVVLCLSVGAGVGAAAHEEPDRTILGIELSPDGNATVYYANAYDLGDDDQRATYESYADNESRRAAFRADAVAELEAAAATGDEEAPWNMSIRNASVRTYEQDGYGRVEVRAEWVRLAYADQRRVIVAQPFRGGYEPDRRVAIHGPEGYERNRTVPQPFRAQRNSVALNPRTSDFSGFFMEFVDPDAETATATATATAASESGDGGGVGLVLRALVVALIPAVLAVLAVRRQ